MAYRPQIKGTWKKPYQNRKEYLAKISWVCPLHHTHCYCFRCKKAMSNERHVTVRDACWREHGWNSSRKTFCIDCAEVETARIGRMYGAGSPEEAAAFRISDLLAAGRRALHSRSGDTRKDAKRRCDANAEHRKNRHPPRIFIDRPEDAAPEECD